MILIIRYEGQFSDKYYQERIVYDRLYRSDDGEDWTEFSVVDESSGSEGGVEFFGYVSANGISLVGDRNGDIYRSEDLGDWEKFDNVLDESRVVVYNHPSRLSLEFKYDEGGVESDGRFRAISHLHETNPGNRGWHRYYEVYSSIDGIEWRYENSEGPDLDEDERMVYAFGRHIRVGENSSVELSEISADAVRSRLVNLSARGYAKNGDETLIVGFVVEDNGTGGVDGEDVLLRGVGQSLVGVDSSALDDLLVVDPSLKLFAGQSVLNENDTAAIDMLSSVFEDVGAMPLVEGSMDAALLENVGSGEYTCHVTDSAGGIALAEVYRLPNAGVELLNLSARAFVSEGHRALIGGFVLAGETSRTILVRGVGKGLEIGGELEDPVLYLYKGQELISSNDDWPSALGPWFEKAGAFVLEEGSSDSSLVLPLMPGVYTVVLVAKEGDEGLALLEIYDLGD